MKKYCRVLLMLAMVLMLTGCSKKNTERAGYQIYYTNAGRTNLLTETYNTEETDPNLLLGELLERMSKTASTPEYYNLIPETVEIIDYTLIDGQVTITFNEAYKQVENVSEILLRAGVVETVSQIPEVSTVVFHIGDKVLTNHANEPVGAMTSSMFINNPVGINSYQYASLTLYFANDSGDKIVKEMRNVHYSTNTTLEKVLMEQLIKGPMNKQLKDVLPSGLQVLSVSVDKKTATINLDKKFLELDGLGVAPEVTIYSIVNSFCDVLNVDKIQFKVEGETDILFGGTLSLNGPFHRNSEIIESADVIGTVDTEAGENAVIAEPSIGL